MSIHDHHEIIKQICDFMGEDLDAPVCKEVAEHIAACPSCQVYFDTVKRTVTLCREIEQDKTIPKQINKRLFKILNLDELKKKE
jgi:predicted anti-sigma-YlaC factor YlaD